MIELIYELFKSCTMALIIALFVIAFFSIVALVVYVGYLIVYFIAKKIIEKENSNE